MSAPARPVPLLLLLVAVALAGTGCGGPGEAADEGPGVASETATGEASPVTPECEQEGYPCTWDQVDPEVTRRIYEMFHPALDLMYQESPTALWDWLQARPDLADAGVEGDTTAVWFRLEGGRPVYVFGPLPPGPDPYLAEVAPGNAPAALSAASPHRLGGHPLLADLAGPLRAALRTGADLAAYLRSAGWRATAPPVHVTGRDRNQDSRVNQRDQRRALVMDPLYFEFCYHSIEDRFDSADEKKQQVDAITKICNGEASPSNLGLSSADVYGHGARVAAALEAMPAYRGNVTLLLDEAADHEVIGTWSRYDVIHLTTHGAPNLWAFGRLFPPPDGDNWQPPEPPFPTAVPVWSQAGRYGPKRGAWAADLTYVASVLPQGMDHTFLFAAACRSQIPEGGASTSELVQYLAGSSSGVLGWRVNIEYDISAFLAGQLYDLLGRGWTVRQGLDSLRLRRQEFLNGSPGTDQAFLSVDDLDYQGKDLRIFEIPTLVKPAPDVPGQRGVPLEDGDPLAPPVVSGIPGDDRADSLTVGVEVVAITEEQASETSVHLELDGASIGEPQSLSDEAKVGDNRYRIRFDGVPAGLDFKIDTDYELEAIVALPEGGESRGAVRLRDRGGCYWRVSFSGARNGENEGFRVMHIYDGGGPVYPGANGAPPRETQQIGGALYNVVGFDISFGDRPLRVGTTGTFVGGAGDDDLSRLSLKFPDVDFAWENEMTGERRPFTVDITVNEEDRLAGTFRGSLLNVPWRNPGGYGRPTVDHGDIDLEGEFQWRPQCRQEEG